MKSDMPECYGTQLPQILHKDISMNIERRRKLTLMLNYTNQIYSVMLDWLRRQHQQITLQFFEEKKPTADEQDLGVNLVKGKVSSECVTDIISIEKIKESEKKC